MRRARRARRAARRSGAPWLEYARQNYHRSEDRLFATIALSVVGAGLVLASQRDLAAVDPLHAVAFVVLVFPPGFALFAGGLALLFADDAVHGAARLSEQAYRLRNLSAAYLLQLAIGLALWATP